MRNYAVLSNRELAEELRERLRLGGGGSIVLSAAQVQEIIKRLPKTKPPGHLRSPGVLSSINSLRIAPGNVNSQTTCPGCQVFKRSIEYLKLSRWFCGAGWLAVQAETVRTAKKPVAPHP